MEKEQGNQSYTRCLKIIKKMRMESNDLKC
jgi:hypothetical protein